MKYVFRKYPEFQKVAFPDGMMTYWKITGQFWLTALGCLSSLSRESLKGTQRKPKYKSGHWGPNIAIKIVILKNAKEKLSD